MLEFDLKTMYEKLFIRNLQWAVQCAIQQDTNLGQLLESHCHDL